MIRELGHYRIDAILGTGGMGVVYRAWDTKLQRAVAIKTLSSTPVEATRSRLLEEARAAAALNHPHICTVYEVSELRDQPFIVMELVQGQPLSEMIRGGSLSLESATRYGAQIADALAHAHERGIVHRDVKSANVVVLPDGRVKVLDFGLAKRQSTVDETTRSHVSLAESGSVVGTLAYMSPELLRGARSDAGSDIWALGIVLYEMVSGQRPFTGRTGFELAAAILDKPVAPFPPKVPAPLRGVIERCLVKEVRGRYRQARDLRVALESLIAAAEPAASLERLFAFSVDMICIAGFDGFFKRVNPAWTATLGWSMEELLSRPYIEFIHPDDRGATLKEAMRTVGVGQGIVNYNNRYQCRDGSYRWLEWSASALVDEKIIYAVARDVTDRRQGDTAQ